MTNKLVYPHRYLADILADHGISPKAFQIEIAMSAGRYRNIVNNPGYPVSDIRGGKNPELGPRIVKTLVTLGVPREKAAAWDEWIDPSTIQTRPRLWYIVEESRFSHNDIIEVIGCGHERYRQWSLRPIGARADGLVRKIRENLIPWLIANGIPAIALENWRDRITAEQRTKELYQQEVVMTLTPDQARSLHLATAHPFARKPYHDEEFFPFAWFEAAVDACVDAVESGVIHFVIGQTGSGKSTIKEIAARRLAQDPSNLVVPLIDFMTDRFQSVHLIDALLEALDGGNLENRSIRAKAQILRRELEARARKNQWPVVVLDEAQHLNDANLTALKQINEWHHEGQRICSFLVFAQPQLLLRVQGARNAEVRKRSFIYEVPFVADEMVAYLHHRLASVLIAGFSPDDLLTAAAWDRFAAIAAVIHQGRITPMEAHDIFTHLLVFAADAVASGAVALPLDEAAVSAAFERFSALLESRPARAAALRAAQ